METAPEASIAMALRCISALITMVSDGVVMRARPRSRSRCVFVMSPE